MIKLINILVWGREFELEVSYDYPSEEYVLEIQKEAMRCFDKHPEWIELAKEKVVKFCAPSVLQDDENEKKENVFSYLKPHYIYVPRNEKNPSVVLLCKYRYNIEHGLAIQFFLDGEVLVDIPDNLF